MYGVRPGNALDSYRQFLLYTKLIILQKTILYFTRHRGSNFYSIFTSPTKLSHSSQTCACSIELVSHPFRRLLGTGRRGVLTVRPARETVCPTGFNIRCSILNLVSGLGSIGRGKEPSDDVVHPPTACQLLEPATRA